MHDRVLSFELLWKWLVDIMDVKFDIVRQPSRWWEKLVGNVKTINVKVYAWALCFSNVNGPDATKYILAALKSVLEGNPRSLRAQICDATRSIWDVNARMYIILTKLFERMVEIADSNEQSRHQQRSGRGR